MTHNVLCSTLRFVTRIEDVIVYLSIYQIA